MLRPGTYRRPSGDLPGSNGKIDNLTIKLYFESNSPSIKYLFLLFTREAHIPKPLMGTQDGPRTKS